MKSPALSVVVAAALVALLSSPLAAAVTPVTAGGVELPEVAPISLTGHSGNHLDKITHDVVAYRRGPGHRPGPGNRPNPCPNPRFPPVRRG